MSFTICNPCFRTISLYVIFGIIYVAVHVAASRGTQSLQDPNCPTGLLGAGQYSDSFFAGFSRPVREEDLPSDPDSILMGTLSSMRTSLFTQQDLSNGQKDVGNSEEVEDEGREVQHY